MTVNTIENIICICSGLFMISFMTMLYVWYAKLEEMESHLQKNTIVMDNVAMWGRAGYAGRIVRSGMIAASLIFASSCSKRGLLDLDEVRSFPKSLRRWIFIPFGSGVFLLLFNTGLLFYLGKI